jgi:hypothetical protein
MENLKALSIKNPWATLIALGIKDVENRTWRTNYRGRFLIHVGLNLDLDENVAYYIACRVNGKKENKLIEYLWKHWVPSWEVQCIIGSVEIIDCIQNNQSIWAEKCCWNWILREPVIFESPIRNVKGQLSFFTPILPPGNILII